MAQAFQSNAFENSAFEASSGGGAIAYSLTCSAGSYTYTGIAANLKLAHTLLCSTGTYSVTGQASLLKVAHKLICGSGSYALNGVSANLRVARTLTCSAGAYTYTGVNATLSYVQPQTLKQIITDLSLTSGLKLCLDAGDKNSYDTAVQTVRWLDTSGNGFDSFRGATGSAEASDPTFNGSVGALTRNEFFSFDGGDYFTYDSTNETWMNNLHKDSAVYTILFVFDYGTASNQALFSTRGTAQGINFVRDAGGGISVTVYNNVSAVNLNAASTATVRSGWNIGAVSVNEPTGAGNFLLNGSANSFTSTYTGTLTALNVTSTAKIATRATASALTAANGAKIACVAIWEGVALTSTQLEDVYTEISKRFEGAYSLTCESGTYTFTGNDASLIYPAAYSLACDVGTYSLTGQNANLKVSRSLTCSAGSYSFVGNNIALNGVRNINANSGSYSITGNDALLKRGYRLTASAGSYSVTGQNATLTYTPNTGFQNYSLTCAGGSYTLTGVSSSLKVSRRVVAESGVYALTGGTAALTYTDNGPAVRSLVCSTGRYFLSDNTYIDDYIDDYYVESNVNFIYTGTPTSVEKSGVNRLWLAQITAELNGMNEVPKETSAKAKPIKQLLTKFIEEADGSVTILDPVQRVKTIEPIVTTRPVKINRPQTVSWAYNILIELINESPIDVWAEEKVLQVLQQAAQEAAEIEAEDELIIELAAQLLF